MDFDEYETLPTNNFSIHMTAGAIAGVMEHCVMYPLDSVKTRMQSLTPQINSPSVTRAVRLVIQQEGLFRLVRGMSAVVAGAGPAHALYFSCYEHLKEKLQAKTAKPFYMIAGLSGGVATLLHDAVMTPTEVVKQRLQMYNSPYKTIFDCVRKTYNSEGMRAFYRSYTTQLTMNIPFQSIHFMTYEVCQNVLNKDKIYNPMAHMISGGVAGAVAAAITTPLDVVKTLLNTQQHRVKGMVAAFKTVYKISGTSGYFKGLRARIIYQMPSTAICWSVYELFKYLLSRQVMEVRYNDKSMTRNLKMDDDASFNIGPGVSLDKEDLNGRELKNINGRMNNWGEIIEESSGKENKSRSLIDEIGRTCADKTKWGNAVLTGTQVLGTLNINATVRGEECDPRSSLFSDERS